jgi:hypothetical protein
MARTFAPQPNAIDPGLARLIVALAREAARRDHADAMRNAQAREGAFNDTGRNLRAVLN